MPGALEIHRVRLGDGRALRVLEWPGADETLLLLHPNGFGAGVFAPLAAELASRDAVPGLAVDLPGHGDSDPPRDRAGFAFGALADDVVEALDRLGADRVSCVGESLGGGVGILADRARPGLINRLVLCEAVAFDLGGRVDGENPMVAGARPAAVLAEPRSRPRRLRAPAPTRRPVARCPRRIPPLGHLRRR